MSWELASFLILGTVLLGGFAWYERSRPTSQVVALVAALAALAIAGRIAFAAFPNVKPTTDIVILAGYALGPAPGFAVGALTALVSNFWFGQGPWTPWQMAGWGLCGILGAGLAVVRPRAGRFTLAAVCGLAGIAYGALLNFSLMATYGGDLSLQRFLALESRAIPFDAAHAIGNATLAFVAGPAMVRMLTRFRQRFEWRTPAVASALLFALLLVSVLPASAQASEASRAASWLISAQNADGGWGSSPDDESAPDMTAWAMLGLEAARHNPLDVSSAGHNPVGYLRAQVDELDSPGDLARTILALHGAGVDPRDFAGHDLVAELATHRRNNGSFEGWPNSTAFAVMALRVGGGGVAQSTTWLARVQNGDGGWGDEPGLPSNADSTAAVMQAMPETTAAQDGLDYLRKAQRPNGGFPLGGNGSVNSQSTAWAVQGMLAVGEDPASVRDGGNNALDYLAARQNADGAYRYSPSSDQTPVWVTSQALAAVAGDPFPIPPVARAPEPTPSDSSTAPSIGSGAAVPAIPPAAGAGTSPVLPESFGQGGVPPATGGVPPATVPGTGVVPALPPGTAPEGDEAETAPSQASAPPFEATENPGPKPWAPLGIGLASSGLALGGVLFLGRRFSW
ncbi:MAG: prenyltransferase/squalene oxidase repeat-containing protein [Solirubrobacterales bacterium]